MFMSLVEKKNSLKKHGTEMEKVFANLEYLTYVVKDNILDLPPSDEGTTEFEERFFSIITLVKLYSETTLFRDHVKLSLLKTKCGDLCALVKEIAFYIEKYTMYMDCDY